MLKILYRNARRGVISIFEYWKSSRGIVNRIGDRDKKNKPNRIKIFLDILYCTFKYGANDINYQMYDFYGKSHEYRDPFITWLRTYKIQNQLDAKVCHDLLSKVVFNERYADCLKRAWIDCRGTTEKDIRLFISRYKIVIAKPIFSALGRGIHILEYENLPLDLSYLIHKEGYILEELLQNAPEIGFINPTSLNTLRFVTATDKFGCYKILSCILRMGVGNSITDNLCTGGIACAVDLSSGKLINNAKDVIGNMYVEHPTSRVKFDGYQIPYFDECLNLIDVLCKRMPNARYVGWDIAISTNGVCVIEGNTPPSEETTEFSLKGQWYDLLKILND